MTSLRDKTVHLRHQTSRHHAKGIEHVFLKMYRWDSFSQTSGICSYCETRLSRGQATADHSIPRSRGGATSRKNIVMCCEGCNKAKGSLSAGKFRNLLNCRALPAEDAAQNSHLVMAWIRARLNKRIKKAERRIKRYVGMPV